MIASPTPLLTRTVRTLFLFFLVVCALYFGQKFLIPVAFAGILSMLFLPLCVKLERKGVNKALAIILCILMLIVFFAGIGALLAWQVSDLAGDVTQMEKRISDGLSQLRDTLTKTFGITPEKQQEMIKKQGPDCSGQ